MTTRRLLLVFFAAFFCAACSNAAAQCPPKPGLTGSASGSSAYGVGGQLTWKSGGCPGHPVE